MLRAIRWLLLILNLGNWLFFAGAIILLALTAAGVAPVTTQIVHKAYAGQERAMLHAFDALVLIGIAVVFAVDILFRRLLAILSTVAMGSPFEAANAWRLRHIAWALLAIQLLDLAFGAAAQQIDTISRRPLPWSPSLTGWLAVLLLFVLARVFAWGAEMQEEIEATV